MLCIFFNCQRHSDVPDFADAAAGGGAPVAAQAVAAADATHQRRLFAFVGDFRLEFDRLVLGQAAEAAHLDRRLAQQTVNIRNTHEALSNSRQGEGGGGG